MLPFEHDKEALFNYYQGIRRHSVQTESYLGWLRKSALNTETFVGTLITMWKDPLDWTYEPTEPMEA